MDSASVETRAWSTICGKFPKEEVIYLSQVVVIFIVIIASLVNLSFGGKENDALWSSVLSGCVGYMLPAPRISKKKNELLPDTTEQ